MYAVIAVELGAPGRFSSNREDSFAYEINSMRATLLTVGLGFFRVKKNSRPN